MSHPEQNGTLKNRNKNGVDEDKQDDAIKTVPRKRQELLNWCGWGYKDTKFVIKNEKLEVFLTGDRYEFCGIDFENCITFFHIMGLDGIPEAKEREVILPTKFPDPILQKKFLDKIQEYKIIHSLDGDDRLFRSHGHTQNELILLKNGDIFERIPDLVVWPANHQEVEKIVEAAVKYDVVLIPFGGGTSVTCALSCSEKEKRMIVSVDTSEMCNILWIDEENLIAKVQAGIIGQDLERKLAAKDLTLGHEPDSIEFSSLGGWVATRASGMKKNRYGNIEDMVIGIKAVTPIGTVEKKCNTPRMSAGPDIHHFLLGSEGILGVITEVTLKVRPVPEVRRYGSLALPDFDAGIEFLREVAYHRCQPASIRLMDNGQFRMSTCFKIPQTSYLGKFKESFKKTYLTWFKGFDLNKMAVATLVFEGDADEVSQQERKIYNIAYKYGALPGGDTNGKNGYRLTFVIAYLRDMAYEQYIMAESMETACPWSKVSSLCDGVKARVKKEFEERGINHFLVCCRVTQTYDTGACIYIYYGFYYKHIEDPCEKFDEIENAIRDEILKNEGNISHHHGIGQKRKQFMENTMSQPALEGLRAIKSRYDPSNTFAVSNLIP